MCRWGNGAGRCTRWVRILLAQSGQGLWAPLPPNWSRCSARNSCLLLAGSLVGSCGCMLAKVDIRRHTTVPVVVTKATRTLKVY